MTLEQIVRSVERLMTRRPPRVIAGSFFSAAMAMVLVGFFRGFPVLGILSAVLGATLVSLIALGLRCLEHRCPSERI